MDITKEPEILTPEEALRLRLSRLVHRVLPPSYQFAQRILLREIEKASPDTLERVRKELLELLK